MADADPRNVAIYRVRKFLAEYFHDVTEESDHAVLDGLTIELVDCLGDVIPG